MYGWEMIYISLTHTGVRFLGENKKGRAISDPAMTGDNLFQRITVL